MLAALTVRDIVLIENAALEFAPGLNVLTGETGAGKSILLDALGLAAGGRGGGRASLRPGATHGSATAVFAPESGHPSNAFLATHALPESEDIVLRRTLTSDGRTRAFVNDEPVGVALLKDMGSLLLEVHGQSDDRGLFDTSTHRTLLDSFGRHQALCLEVADAFAAYDTARLNLAELRRAAAEAAADADYVRHAYDELSDLAVEAGEETRLVGQRSLLVNANRIADDLQVTIALLAGDAGAESSLASALKKLSRMNEEARKASGNAEQALEQAYNATAEGLRELESLLARLEFEPGKLEQIEDRIHDIRAAARKYAVVPDTLPLLFAEFESKRDALSGGGKALKAAEAAVAAASQIYFSAAGKLSHARKTSARRLEESVAEELAPLKLGHARFRVTLQALPESEASASGLERVAFEVATIDGASFGSLTKIASGGELARFSLALKVALAESSPPAALVFDEVDRGVGGAVADAVGVRLQQLAQTTQVLLVTHSPQVAARAARHFRIVRIGDKTRVVMLDESERLEEIARMLSGAAITDEARAAARRLMAEAMPKKRKRA